MTTPHIAEAPALQPQCRHQEGRGMCYLCAPWMFPNGCDEARLAYARWHIDQGIPLPREWRKREEDLAWLSGRR